MKKEFSNKWISSTQPRKQRKYRAKAPLHLRKKFVSANLSKELRKKYEQRSAVVKTGDTVKIMRGKFTGKQGKITKVMLKISKVIIEGIQAKKQDGSKVSIKMQPSNLQIVTLNLEDNKRMKKEEKTEKKMKVEKKETEKPKKEKSDDKIKKMEKKVESKNKTEEKKK